MATNPETQAEATPTPRIRRTRAEAAANAERQRLPKAKRELLDKLDVTFEAYVDPSEGAEKSTPQAVLAIAAQDIAESPLTNNEKAEYMMHVGAMVSGVLEDEEASAAIDKEVRRLYLPEILGAQSYRDMSREIGKVLRTEKSVPVGYFGELSEVEDEAEHATLDEETLEAQLPTLAGLSPSVRGAVLDRLVDSNLINGANGGYDFPTRTKQQKYLLSGALELTDGWQRAKLHMVDGSSVKSLDDAEEVLRKHNEKRAISEVVFTIDKPGFAVAPINGLKIGHQDSLEGIQLVRNYLAYVNELPEDEKPDVLLVTDLIQGVFKHNQSKKRSALPGQFQDANAQFRISHELLDEMRATGIPVVVSMGENDHREAQDYATDAVRELEEFLKDGETNDFVHFGQLYKYSQNAMWQDFRQFALDYAIPLGHKYGRRLRTSAEMEVDSEGTISQSEFMHLYEHIKLGHTLSPVTGVDPDDLTGLGVWGTDKSIIYVDDADLIFNTNDGKESRIKYRHALGLTTESLLGNHMAKPQKLMGMLGMAAATIDELPTALMTGQPQEAAMVTHSGTDIISSPGLTNPMNSVDTRAFYRRTPGDTSLRAFTTRGRTWDPGIYEYSRPEKGVVKYTMYDADIMERSESIPRMAIVTFNDWQTGSPTAHLDMVVHAQALAQRYASRMPTAIHGEGDFVHGWLYPNMAREAQAIGLMDIDSQSELNNSIIRDTWRDAPAATKDGIFDLMWQWGNHDEAQRMQVPSNHSRNVDSTLEVWRRVLDNPDVAPEDSIIRTERVFQGDDGTPVPTWIGRPRYGDVNMAISHFHVNSKNYKGGTGGLAAYDPLKRLEGMGGFEDIQIASGAHHHNRMHIKANGLWSDIGDANAAGQSEFENMLGMHHSSMSVKVREIGGGQPMTVTYYSEEALIREAVQQGPYSQAELADAGYFDDPGADPLRYGQYSLDGSPKTAIQKRLWTKQREASQWANHMSEPLIVPRGHQNRVTRRLFEIAARLADGQPGEQAS